MTFTTPLYLLFLPAVFLVFYFSPDRLRWLVLLLASAAFYAALDSPLLLAALFAVVLASYFCGGWLAAEPDPRRKSRLLWLGIAANLGILIGFRYLGVLLGAVNLLSSSFREGRQVVGMIDPVAIGVSYYSFQAISYLVDVYLDVQKPEKHLGRFALYLSFFPKLLQGPIERAGELLPQLNRPYAFSYDNMRSGLLMFGIGLFKKLVIADRLALFVNEVYGDVHAFSGLPLIIGTYFYAFQIYCDFSGYTDMALGAGRLFNIQLTQNFESPYRATSIAEFWRRWHISFSRWILDYIFTPLQFKFRRWAAWGTAAALTLTFLLCGVWHGAAATFVSWGLLHGLYMSASVLYRRLRGHAKESLPGRLRRAWQVAVTFHLVCLGWVFFRSRSVADALYLIEHAFTGLPNSVAVLAAGGTLQREVYLNQSSREFYLALCCLGLLALLRRAGTTSDAVSQTFFRWTPGWLRWSTYLGLVLALVVFGVFYGGAFIYYQF